MSESDGGPAFPITTENLYSTGGQGMTLRDYFAGQALAGVLASPIGRIDSGEILAGICYEAADAMLAARARPHE